MAASLIVGGSLSGLLAGAAAAQPAPPGTTVGGLDLAGYCQTMGDAVVLKGNIEAPGAAYEWFCVTSSGRQVPVNMAAACQYQYPGQYSVAYATDANNAYSWVCIAPAGGNTILSPGYVALVSSTGTLIIQTVGGTTAISFDGAGGTSAGSQLVVNPDGSGYFAFEGAGGGISGVVTFDGALGGIAG